MAEVTWFKVLTDIFSDDKIKILQSMPEGDSLMVMWFKVLAQAGKTNDGGYIYLKKDMPYTPGMLSTLFNKPQQLVEMALKTFTQFDMIDIDDNGYIFVTKWEKHQNVNGMEKVRIQTNNRVKKHRELKRLELMGSDPCQYCGGVATGFDHILATARGGKDVEENKVPCCIDCNRKKNDKPLVDFLNWERHLGNINDELITSNAKLSKFITMCNVTDRYIVTPCNAIEVEVDLDKEKDTTTDEDDYRKVNAAYARIHGKRDIETQYWPLLTTLLKEGIPADLMVEVMEQRYKEKTILGQKVSGFGYYQDVFRDKFRQKEKPAPAARRKVDQELESRHREIARNKWISEGKNPNEFEYRPAAND